jgi:hypothetical protein
VVTACSTQDTCAKAQMTSRCGVDGNVLPDGFRSVLLIRHYIPRLAYNKLISSSRVYGMLINSVVYVTAIKATLSESGRSGDR